jgi:hypothetical protein
MVLLYLGAYNGLDDVYSFTDKYTMELDDTDDYDLTNGNIMQQFESMTLLTGINTLQAGILQLTPGDSQFDVLGGLTASAIGFTQVLIGIISAPFAILSILSSYYGGNIIPTYIIGGLAALVTVYAFFIVLSAYLRSDI